MARHAKSATVRGTYEGDIRSHSFIINPDPAAEQFYTDTDGGLFANPYITLDYVCLRCHAEDSTPKDLTWAGDNVDQIHP